MSSTVETAPALVIPDANRVDHCVLLRNVSWEHYEALLAARGEDAGPRMTYLRGELEIMSPSIDHEAITTMFGRLVEAFAEEAGIDLNGYGSWTLKSQPVERGLEPDECYSIGQERPQAPDLAIEVIWTRRLLDKLEAYRGLGIREVWVWRQGRIEIHVLRGDRYERADRSEVLPALDMNLLARFLTRGDQTKAVREFRQALRAISPR